MVVVPVLLRQATAEHRLVSVGNDNCVWVKYNNGVDDRTKGEYG